MIARGDGESFSRDLPVESMNVERSLSDTHEQVTLLRSRYRA